MVNDTLVYILPAAYILDMVLGDPRWLPHPVVWMGNAISFFEPSFRCMIKRELLSGLLFALFLILSAWGLAVALTWISCIIHPYVGIAVQAFLMFFCLSARTLEKAASEVGAALEKGSSDSRDSFEGGASDECNNTLNSEVSDSRLDAARLKVSMIVGREVKYLNETGVVKAAVETVAENFVDGFLSPIFFALAGGIPAAVAYKMINTLDSMVGYRNDKYILFGRAAARIDDIANFIPARLSVVIISVAAALISIKRGKLAFKTAVMEGREHKSPNSGYPEAAFAGALEVKLGGPNYYHGTLVEKPYIGKNFQSPGKEKIRTACELMLFSSLVVIAVFIIIAALFHCDLSI